MALLFLVDGLSYEEALADPVIGALVRSGGIGLMTNAGVTGPAADAALGAGATIDRPFPEPVGTPRGNAVLDVEDLPAPPEGAAPGLLAQRLIAAGRSVGYVTRCCEPGRRGSIRGTLTAIDVAGRIHLGLGLDHRGNFGLHGLPQLYRGRFARADLVVLDLDEWMPNADGVDFDVRRQLVTWVRESAAEELLVVVAVPSPSEEMEERTGTVTPIVVARGRPVELLRGDGETAGLTSDSTRLGGVVSNLDVAPTILDFLGMPIPDGMDGSPILVEGEAPTALHERYVEWRRSAGPVGLGVLAFALTALATALVLLVVPWNPGGRVRAAVALWVLFSVALLVALVPASLLPDLRPLAAALGVVVIGAILAAAAFVAARRSPTLEVALVAAVGLGLVVLDGALGWPTGVTPLLGGSALEGVRFFGLGNPYAGIVLSGALLTAALLRPWPGVVLLGAAGLFAGLPFLGADLGGGVTLFAVAAVWYGLRVRGRLAVPEWALVGAAAVAGLALLVIAHRTLPPGATHVARAFEGAGPGDLLGVFLDRLALNLRATTEVPAAWLAVLGLPAGLVVAWRGPGRFATLAREPAWRDAAIALALGGMIGYVVNDTYGMAAVTFTFLAGAVLVPALRWTSG